MCAFTCGVFILRTDLIAGAGTNPKVQFIRLDSDLIKSHGSPLATSRYINAELVYKLYLMKLYFECDIKFVR